MIVIFKHEYLKTLYESGVCDKKHRFQPEIMKNYKKVITQLKYASRIESLYRISSLNYERLVGDKAGTSSVRVNKKYRIEFEELTQDGESIITICKITNLTNHYK